MHYIKSPVFRGLYIFCLFFVVCPNKPLGFSYIQVNKKWSGLNLLYSAVLYSPNHRKGLIKMTLDKNTEKLLEGLGADVVTIRGLARRTARSGVFVRVRIGRSRGCINLPPKAVGVRTDRMKKDTLDAYRSVVNLGNLVFIPKELDNELSRLDNQIRRQLARYTTVDGFMPVSVYSTFKEDFQKLKREYMEQRDIIVNTWDALVETFSVNVRVMLDGIRMLKRDRAKLYDTIMKNLPSKEAYAASFYMQLEVSAFPAAPEAGVLDPSIAADIEEAWQDNVVSTAVKSIATCLTTVFDAANKAIKGYMTKGAFSYKSFQYLVDLGGRTRCLNVFSNPAISKVADLLSKLDFGDQITAEEQVEYCMAYIHGYAKETGVALNMADCVLTEDALAEILRVKEAAEMRQAG